MSICSTTFDYHFKSTFYLRISYIILASLEICFNIPENNIIVFTFQIDVFYEITFFKAVFDMNSGALNLLYSKRLQNIEKDAPFSNSEKNVCDIMYEPNFNQISLDLNDRKSKLNYHYESSIPSGIMPTELEKNAVQKPNLDIGRYFAERVS